MRRRDLRQSHRQRRMHWNRAALDESVWINRNNVCRVAEESPPDQNPASGAVASPNAADLTPHAVQDRQVKAAEPAVRVWFAEVVEHATGFEFAAEPAARATMGIASNHGRAMVAPRPRRTVRRVGVGGMEVTRWLGSGISKLRRRRGDR